MTFPYGTLVDRRRRFKEMENDDERRASLKALLNDLEDNDVSNAAFWGVLEWFIGENYSDELVRLGVLEEELLCELESEEEEGEPYPVDPNIDPVWKV